MRKERLYLFLVLVFALGFILPKLFNPRQGFIFIIEELTFGIGLILGILIFSKRVRAIVVKLEERYSWETNSSKRLWKDAAYWLMYATALGGFLFICSRMYMHYIGFPEFYQEILKTKSMMTGPHAPPGLPPPGAPPPGPPPHLGNHGFWHGLPSSLGFSSLLFAVLFLIEEITVYGERKAREQIAIQEMLKEQALMKASVLKKQLNPHFMFNTLNVLSGLIHEDIDRADIFIKELAETYRYVLEQSESALSTLEQEATFIESYFYLLKIRFEEKLKYNIEIPEAKLAHQIPSLTFEILVENAIKHNAISESMPLTIDIYTNENRLIVKNNLQLREDEVASIGKGIRNLEERLKLLGIHDATFGIQSGYYVASIPLLASTE
ncbi:MAG: sensor histidine kinase [Bacteroidia bacterium]